MTNQAKTAGTPKRLRAKMSAVLSARSRLVEAKATLAAASREHDRHKELAFEPTSVPPSTEIIEVQAFLSDLEAHHLRYQSAVRPLLQERIRLSLANIAWNKATTQLAEEVAAAKQKPELESDRVLLGAARMSEIAKPGKEVAEPESLPDEVEETTFDSELSELEEALRKAVLELSITCARAHSMAPALAEARKDIGNYSKPEIEFPVRPTEEEVQRFLQQTEQFMVYRLDAHRLLLRLLAKREEFIELIDSQRAALGEALRIFCQTLDPSLVEVAELESGEITEGEDEPKSIKKIVPPPPEHFRPIPSRLPDRSEESTFEVKLPKFDLNTEALLAFCELALVRFASWAKSALGDSYDTSHLDSVNKPNAGVSDSGKIDELRKLMHTYAVACGHRNETLSALGDAQNIPEMKIEIVGIAQNKNWQESLDWRADLARQQEDASKHNLTRSERISLLEESSMEYKDQISRARRIMHRFIITIIPSADQPEAPDELRILTNAEAWMAHPEGEVSEGGYPVY